MNKKALVGPLIGILVAVIVAVAVVIPVTISVLGTSTSAFGGYNLSSSTYSFAATAFTVAQLFPLLVAVLVLVGIAGYMTLQG
jgi:hypothetical protein